MKKTIVTFVLISLLLSSAAFAGPMCARGNASCKQGCMDQQGNGPGWCQHSALQQLPQEKQAALQSILDKHRKETEPLRTSMWEKRTLLHALSANQNTKPETLTALVQEMSALRTQLHASRDALRAQVSTEVGVNLPQGYGRMGQGKGGNWNR